MTPPLLVLAGDDGYARPMEVVISSIVGHTPGEFDLLVIDDGLSSSSVHRLRQAAGSHDLQVAALPEEWLVDLPEHRTLPRSTWFRVFVCRIARSHDRLVYLDGDLLARRSLRPLIDAELGEATIGAVAETGVAYVGSPEGRANLPGTARLGLPPAMRLFNAGVLIIDRQRWVERQVAERVLELLADPLQAQGCNDQGYLNLVLWREWHPLDERWNSRRDDAWLAHFYGPFKPWKAPRLPNRLYVDYLDAAERIGWDLPGAARLRRGELLRRLAADVVPPGLEQAWHRRPWASPARRDPSGRSATT